MAITFEQFLDGKEFYVGEQKEVSGYAKVVEGIPVSIHFSDETVVDIQHIAEQSVVFSFSACGLHFFQCLHINHCFLR